MKHCSHSRTAQQSPNRQITRRAFIHGLGVAAAGLALASCQPTRTDVPSPIAPVKEGAKSTVAISKANQYDRALIRQQLETLLDGIGGIADVLGHGNRVAIKTNLTGGSFVRPLAGVKAIDSYLTHPEVIRAMVELLHDSGVKDVFIVEAIAEPRSWPAFEYTEMAKEAGATLVDLSFCEPYKDFVKVAPGTEKPVYESYTFNPVLQEIDAFISISKMKCHNIAGVTHTMKNLFGLVPCRLYQLKPEDTMRSAFHGQSSETGTRVPQIICDLNKARPVNLSIIDGVLTTEGGEGPWIKAMKPIKPGVLLAGKDPVATDAVATAAMGFDPTADYPNEPFVNGVNHLNIAARMGIGTNQLEEIQVVGAAIEDVKMKFTPSY